MHYSFAFLLPYGIYLISFMFSFAVILPLIVRTDSTMLLFSPFLTTLLPALFHLRIDACYRAGCWIPLGRFSDARLAGIICTVCDRVMLVDFISVFRTALASAQPQSRIHLCIQVTFGTPLGRFSIVCLAGTIRIGCNRVLVLVDWIPHFRTALSSSRLWMEYWFFRIFSGEISFSRPKYFVYTHFHFIFHSTCHFLPLFSF